MFRRVSTLIAVILPLALIPLGADEAGKAPGGSYLPSDAERARWTMSDMRSLAVAIEAYRLDHDGYPIAVSFEELLPLIEPAYIRKAPATDAWGTPLWYVPTADSRGFQIVSAGADGAFDEAGWSHDGENAAFTDDAVLRNGKLTRTWAYR